MRHRRILLLLATAALAGVGAAEASKTVGEVRNLIVRRALDPLGTPYVWGGTTPGKGLDCSGFALTVYRWAGLDMPRTSNEQFRTTRYLEPNQARRGDLVFFNMKLNPRKKVDHVGIYLGHGWFAHASFSRGILIDNLRKPYYRERLQGIRRHPSLGGGR